MISGYLRFLPQYSAKQLIDAMEEYVVNGGRDIPTVYDLKKILEPKKEPLCPRMYSVIQARKKRGDYLTANEDRFVKAYEQQQYDKLS